MSNKEILKFALDFRNGFLGKKASFNMCYVLSSQLSTMLSMAGVENEIVRFEIYSEESRFIVNAEVIEHFCIQIGNDILDPTADQFKNMPKVYFGSQPSQYQEIMY